jgi:hypothetical protein
MDAGSALSSASSAAARASSSASSLQPPGSASSPPWRLFGALSWEQTQSLILALFVIAIVVIPQWCFSLVKVPADYERVVAEKRKKRQEFLLKKVLSFTPTPSTKASAAAPKED